MVGGDGDVGDACVHRAVGEHTQASRKRRGVGAALRDKALQAAAEARQVALRRGAKAQSREELEVEQRLAIVLTNTQREQKEQALAAVQANRHARTLVADEAHQAAVRAACGGGGGAPARSARGGCGGCLGMQRSGGGGGAINRRHAYLSSPERWTICGDLTGLPHAAGAPPRHRRGHHSHHVGEGRGWRARW